MGQFLPSLLVLACSGLAVWGIVSGTRRYRWFQQHWLGFAFLLPFLVMLWLHGALGLSDAIMVATPPGEREARIFNFLMVVVFYGGIAAFIAHSSYMPNQRRRWVAAKVAVLIGYWGGVLYFWS